MILKELKNLSQLSVQVLKGENAWERGLPEL
jgi:hypothetical protein